MSDVTVRRWRRINYFYELTFVCRDWNGDSLICVHITFCDTKRYFIVGLGARELNEAIKDFIIGLRAEETRIHSPKKITVRIK